MSRRRTNFQQSIPVGVIIRSTPSQSRWIDVTYQVIGLLPGAPAANWAELRRDGDIVDYHAATLQLDLHRTDTDAYLVALDTEPPSAYVVMQSEPGDDDRPRPVTITASPYEAQDHLDAGDDIVERVPMPPEMVDWVRDYIAKHHKEDPFYKRSRDRTDLDRVEDGRGDARIRQHGDVFRSPQIPGHSKNKTN